MEEEKYGDQMGTEDRPEGEGDRAEGNHFVDTEIRDMILKRKRVSQDYYEDVQDIHDKCFDHYKQVYDKTNKEPWQSTVFIPLSPKVSEVITSNLYSALLTPNRPVEWKARSPEFEDIVRDVNDIIAVHMEKDKFKVKFNDSLRNDSIIGTFVGKVEYKKEYADVEVRERKKPIPGLGALSKLFGGGETTTTKRVITKNHACYKDVDRYDIFPEPGTEEFCKDRWVIERGKICNYKLLELEKEGEVENITQELLLSNPKNLKDPDGEKANKEEAFQQAQDLTAYMDPDQEHELLEYWGPAPIWMVHPELYGVEEFQYDIAHAWFWLIDGVYVVKKVRTPWRDAEPPYVRGTYIQVPGRFDGIGPLELCMGLQIEANEGVNTRQDEINIKLSKPVIVNKDMVPEGFWGRLVSKPGAIWPVTNVDDVRKAIMTVEYDANMADSWRSTQLIMQETEEVTAAVKATIGAGGADTEAGGGTFRGQLLNKQVAAERFIMYARNIEQTALSNAVRKIYQRIYQYMDYEDVERILGPERASRFEFPAPEDLENMAELVPQGVLSMENKGVKLAQMAEQYKMFSGQPWFKPFEHARRMMIVGGDDPDTSIMTEDELRQYNEAKRMMIQQEGVAPGSPPPSGGPSSPIAGDVPPSPDGLPLPAQPARGPGASTIDGQGIPL